MQKPTQTISKSRSTLIVLICGLCGIAGGITQVASLNNDTPVDSSAPLLQALDCKDGFAGALFPCESVFMSSRLDLRRSGLPATAGNDIWGWTHPASGREFALVGLNSKMAVVEITDPVNPFHWGDLATHTRNSIWRDIKVYKDHAFVVSEAWQHGLQVFDLNQLIDKNPNGAPYVFSETAYYGEFGSGHNIAINEDSGFAYVVGSDTCDAGMHVVDIRNPTRPVFSTCVDKSIFEPALVDGFVTAKSNAKVMHGEDYTHDVQCVQYAGPDHRYTGREICIASNADTVNIVDMTNKSQPAQISVKNYPGLGYTHQGWLTEDHRYFLLGDELDEMQYKHNTRTLIWDMADLKNPKHIGDYYGPVKAIDHNMYIKGNKVYQSNYDSGLRIVDLAKVGEGILREVAFFDTEPNSNKAEFLGAWSVYPYFKSGSIVISNISGHLFTVKEN